MHPTVFLFDMDGVLVKPGGYRAAVRATVNYFSSQLGFGNIAPDDATIALFEAEGITSEWDMIPILLCLAIESAVARAKGLMASAGGPEREDCSMPTFQAACVWLTNHPVQDFSIDFAPMLRGLNRYVRVGEAPAQSILAAARSGQARDLFPFLASQGVLDELLSATRSLVHSQTTPVFEAFVLGDAVFARTTGLPVPVCSESLLAQYDEPLLLPATQTRLRQVQDEKGLRISVYTARPSRSDGGVQEPLAVFAPEAEMALERVGWPDLMVVGTGQAGEMAWALGVSEDRLTKPAPYHAIAAIAAAWTGNRRAALDWSEQVFYFFEKDHPCAHAVQPLLETPAGALPEKLDLHIFEDSPSGMQGGRLAAELLAQLGMQVTLSLWGVTDHSEKAAALAALGAQVFPDINKAVGAALKTIPGV